MALVILVHVFRVKTVVPGKYRLCGGAIALGRKVVFHMTLRANQAALFIARNLAPVPAGTLEPVGQGH